MSYLGYSPLVGQYRKMDDITPLFNGSDTTFPITVGGISFSPPTAYAMMVVLNGVVQDPDIQFSIAGPVLTITTAPAALTPFFGIIMGDTLYTGTPSDATVTNSKIAVGTINYDRFSVNTQATLTANQIIFGV